MPKVSWENPEGLWENLARVEFGEVTQHGCKVIAYSSILESFHLLAGHHMRKATVFVIIPSFDSAHTEISKIL